MKLRSPEQSASPFSRLYFRWVHPTLKRGMTEPLGVATLLPLNATEDPEVCDAAFSARMQANHLKSRPVLRSMAELHWPTLARVFGVSMLNLTATLGSPLILRNLVRSLNDAKGAASANTVALALLLFVSALTSSMTAHHMFHMLLKLMVRVRIGLVSAIYRKALALTVESRQKAPAGKIINLMGTDAQKFVNALNVCHSLWVHPLQLTLVMAILYWILGPASLAGATLLGLFLYLSSIVARKALAARKELVKQSDVRVGLMNEILMSIRVIKFYAWEKSFDAQVMGVRGREVTQLERLARLGSIGGLLFLSSPVVVAVATFATFVLAGNELKPGDVFASLALFNVLRQAMVTLPDMVTLWLDANVSIRRVEDFLLLPELRKRAEPAAARGAVSLGNATFEWTAEAVALAEASLEIAPGAMICVVGAVGSGKSALVSAILGDLNLRSGRAEVAGKVAYVPQQAWILNDTVRNNIVFGSPFDPVKYREALRVTQLLQDLQQFPSGDATEVGERGVNLSGGQRQRISLARAVYCDADIYLMDDPLSALDTKVAQAVYDDCVCGHLRGKTRLLTTHRLEFVERADRVVVMEQGRLVEGRSAAFEQLWTAYLRSARVHGARTTHAEPADETDEIVLAPTEAAKAAGARLMTEEERNTGVVGWSVYLKYFAAFVPGALAFLMGTAFVAKELLNVGTDSWLAFWSTRQPFDSTKFLLGYLALGIVACTATYLRTLLVSLRGLAAGTSFHTGLLRSVLAAPMGFFEATPVGRVLNRFSRDMEAIDQQIPRSLLDALGCVFSIVSTLAVVVAVTPFALLGVVPIAFLYWRVQRTFRPASREGQRVDSITRSPIFAQFSETLAGVAVIRAFAAEPRFEGELLRNLETNSRSFYTIVSANRWLGTRIETLGAAIVACAAFASVLSANALGLGFVGLSVTYALAITGSMNWAVRMFSQLESNLNSVERIDHYTQLPREKWEGEQPAEAWPSAGNIVFEGLTLRYRADLPPVVTDLHCTIKAGEKVGIVGRTGAGKSTLLLALYRLLEASGGRILIDGVDLAGLELATLRGRLAIIPQEPTLFRGTVRKNLDPFGLHDEKKLWDALDRAALRKMVERMPNALDSDVHEGGSNFSVGQKQLLCLARALLKETRVLLLDEATASVDVATDALIQETIKSEFRAATVITIAHRLGTVMDCDRIMVLEGGRLVEFDAPEALLGKRRGLFSAMVAEESVAATAN